MHSYHRRRPYDVPFGGRFVQVKLRIRRYICRNAACWRRTYAGPLAVRLAPLA
ncbi:hypothetical protein [Microvirga sp. VF16]|uniref:hypothetical protein n=1 Tax=Microvirga sp. VF16 TaxID=2807101 RepID=UPI00352FF237